MNPDIFLSPQVAWATGALAGGPLIRKTTRLADLPGIFANSEAWKCGDPQQSVYDVDVLGSPVGEGRFSSASPTCMQGAWAMSSL